MDLLAELRHSARGFARTPIFAAVAVTSLALGIGANSAIFSLIDQLVLRLLPVENARRLVLLSSHGSHYGNNRGSDSMSYPMYEEIRDQNSVFEGVLCRFGTSASLTRDGVSERIPIELVSGNYFQVLGVKAALGRTFTPDDDRIPGGHPLAVLSHGYWKSRFSGDPSIIGKSLVVNGAALTVIGVSQEGFDGTEADRAPQLRVPITMKALMTPNWDDLKDRRSRWVQVYGLLRQGVTPQQAQAALAPFFHAILEREVQEAAFRNATSYTKEQFLKTWLEARPAARGRSSLRDQYSKPLWALMGITGFVLLIACANVANLLLVRASAREREFAVRLSLGGTRGGLMGKLLAESLMLSLAGGVLGLAIAWLLVTVLTGFLPSGDTVSAVSAVPDFRVFSFCFGLSLLTGTAFGLLPAWRATRPDLASSLKTQGNAPSASGGDSLLRHGLAAGQVALSLLLLVGAGLFMRSLQNLQTLDPGLQIENVASFRMEPKLNSYSNAAAFQLYTTLLERLRANAGVRSAGAALVAILEGDEWDSTVSVEGYTAKPGENTNPFCNAITPGYFETLGIPLAGGRNFTSRDAANAPKVAIVNERFVKHYFGHGIAVGRHIGFGGNPGTKTDIEIIGVVKDAKYLGLREAIPEQAFFPYEQVAAGQGAVFFVRTTVNPEAVLSQVRAEVRALDAALPIYAMRTMRVQVERSLLTERLIATLASGFGILATLLAAIGLYGVLAFSVERRTREIGIRMALGAVRGRILRSVLRDVLVLVAAGTLAGLPLAFVLARLLESQLFGVAPHDPATAIGAAAALALVALAAGFLPARRAASVEPMRALRYE